MGEPIAEVGDLAGICGHDGTSWEKVLIDASKRLVVAIASAIAQDVHVYGFDDPDWLELACDSDGYLKITMPYEEALGARQYQYDGSSWRRSNMLLGYNTVLDEDAGGTASGTSYTFATSAVPSGELWILQAASIRESNRNTGPVQIYITKNSGALIFIAFSASLTRYYPLLVTGEFVMAEGDTLSFYVGGTVAGDTIQGGALGYKMDLEM